MFGTIFALFLKSGQKSLHAKKGQNIYIKALFESSKRVNQAFFKPKSAYNKPCFKIAYYSENVTEILKQKEAQTIDTSSSQNITMSFRK